jgi:hypothetical protein
MKRIIFLIIIILALNIINANSQWKQINNGIPNNLDTLAVEPIIDSDGNNINTT